MMRLDVRPPGCGFGVLDIRSMPKATRKGPGRPATGRERFIVSFAPGQLAELRREAFKRAAAIGSAKPDVSALVREAVAEWVAKRRAR